MNDVTAVLMYKVRPRRGAVPQTVGFEGGKIKTIIFKCSHKDAHSMAKEELDKHQSNIDWYQFQTTSIGDLIETY